MRLDAEADAAAVRALAERVAQFTSLPVIDHTGSTGADEELL